MIEIVDPSPDQPYAVLLAHQGMAPTDIPQADFINAYKRFGALLLRGFNVDIAGFRTLTSAYCSGSVFNESPDRVVLDAEQNIQTVNLGVDAFPLHPELSREPWKPDVCFFWCINPPGRGGETTVCDGIEIVRHMPPDVFEAFRDRWLVHTQRMAPEVCAYWLGSPDPDEAALRNPGTNCPYTFARAPGGVVRSFSRPALHKPMFADELAFGNFILFARYYLRLLNFPAFDGNERIPDDLVARVKEISDGITVPVQWRKGDVIVLDNTRFMHGRNAIMDARKRQIATFFGYLNFAEPPPQEIASAPWRKSAFRPPQPAQSQRAR